METRATDLSKDKNNVQSDEQEAVSSRCVRPKKPSGPNREYPPIIFHPVSSPRYDPKMRMYFFSDKQDDLSLNNIVVSVPEERDDFAVANNRNRICIIL